ncbi:MAG: response regulator [Clostridia bacterium]|nr:response regulator [Clostridia bacterium]
MTECRFCLWKNCRKPSDIIPNKLGYFSAYAAGGVLLRVYILDVQDKIRDQLLKVLSEYNKADEIMAFEDYARFIGHTQLSPPDYCFIRLGRNEIPGLKAAGAVQRISTSTRVVFVSEDRRYAVDAYEVGAYGYLSTPLTKEKLDNYLENNN